MWKSWCSPKSSLLELTGVHLLSLAGAASLSWRVPEQLMGSTHHHGLRAFRGKKNCRWAAQCLAVPAARVTPPAPTASEQGEPGELPLCRDVFPAETGMVQGLGRRRDTHPAVWPSGFVVWENNGNVAMSAMLPWQGCFSVFLSTSGLAFFSHFLKTNLNNQQLPSPNKNLTICPHFSPSFYKLLFTMQRHHLSASHVMSPLPV